jgi:superoxide reductase
MAGQTAGTDLFAQVNVAKDKANLTDMEKKHLPVITAPDTVKSGECFTVTVEVGKLLPHPNERAHHIEFVELYEDRLYLCRADFSAVRTCPRVTFSVALTKGGLLRAFEVCNLHGVWEAERPIKVSE